ncbi:seven transmembrane MLO family protein [Actinidia rufa]|uniref:Seven transmembrane MLO family protein n=1 Tax=Actinidia rufa TaxID=165716 RepID=A0A7J0E3C9_9ERIC|nr:seven transmembrane MLO family protein [Actinidia rufa]
MGEGEGRSLVETPTWAVATVVLVMVTLGFFFQGSLKQFGKWLDRTKRKALLAALDKIKEELMLFGLLSLLMGHWIIFVAKICVKSSVLSSRFYPCLPRTDMRASMSLNHFTISSSSYVNYSVSREQVNDVHNGFCSELQHLFSVQGHDSFASYESLEQLHRFLFVLGVTHVAYSFFAIALATIKVSFSPSKHTAFLRQFWSSINRADYMALRLGFITTHQLSLSYDFHNYMLRSIEDEFCDIVGIRYYYLLYFGAGFAYM